MVPPTRKEGLRHGRMETNKRQLQEEPRCTASKRTFRAGQVLSKKQQKPHEKAPSSFPPLPHDRVNVADESLQSSSELTSIPKSSPEPLQRQHRQQQKKQNESSGKDSKRSKNIAALQLPDIPGLDMQIIPLHVNALKKTTKYFQQNHPSWIAPYPVPESSDEGQIMAGDERGDDVADSVRQDNHREDDNSVMEKIFNRLQQSEKEQEKPDFVTRQKEAQILHQKQDSMKQWLQAIRLQLRDQRQQQIYKEQQNERNAAGNEEETKQSTRITRRSSKNVAVAALEHLWNVGQEHARVTVRRAALHLAGHLLDKSADCRRWLLDEDNRAPVRNTESDAKAGVDSQLSPLTAWMDCITTSASSVPESASSENDNNHQVEQQRLRAWEVEGYLLLLHLRENFGEFYDKNNRLQVALWRYEQLCPSVVRLLQRTATTTSMLNESSNILDTNTTMLDWRRWRDLALQHWREEERRLSRFIQRCQECMDILVPRIGDHNESNDTGNIPKNSLMDGPSVKEEGKVKDNQADVDDETDDDVDWEDGISAMPEDKELNSTDAQLSSEQCLGNEEDHIAAVERTLQIMQTAVAGLRDGRLQIDLQRQSNDDLREGIRPDHDPAQNSETFLARARLLRYVRILSERHMPRLTAWVEGLMNADSLVQAKPGDPWIQASNVSERKDVLSRVLTLKQNVAQVISSAKRIGIVDNRASGATEENTSPVVATVARVHSRLVTAYSGNILMSSSRRHSNLSFTMAQSQRRQGQARALSTTARRDYSRPRSNRIQIKFRKI